MSVPIVTLPKARLVDDGDDQFVLSPGAFAFDCEEVLIRKEGDTVIHEPVRKAAEEDN